MPTTREHVVCFGRDRTLLYTRTQLLQLAKFPTLATADLGVFESWLLKGDVIMLVLCHTVTADDVAAISRFYRESGCTAPIVRLSAGRVRPALGDGGVVCDAQKGPAAFLAAVREVSIGSNISA